MQVLAKEWQMLVLPMAHKQQGAVASRFDGRQKTQYAVPIDLIQSLCGLIEHQQQRRLDHRPRY